jgi:hypothetical protein
MMVAAEEAARVAEFKRNGYTIYRGLYSADTIHRLRSILEPEFTAIFRHQREIDDATGSSSSSSSSSSSNSQLRATPGDETDWARVKLGSPVEGGDAGGRNSASGGLLNHPLWPQLEPILHAPWHTTEVLDLLERVFGPFVQLDGFGITANPPPDDHEARAGVLQGWHRDSSIASRFESFGVGSEYEGQLQSWASAPAFVPPIGVNLLCCE